MCRHLFDFISIRRVAPDADSRQTNATDSDRDLTRRTSYHLLHLPSHFLAMPESDIELELLLERKWLMAEAAERAALSRHTRAARAAEQEKAEVVAQQREVTDLQQSTARILSEADAMKEMLRALESAKVTAAQQEKDLTSAVIAQREDIRQMEQDKEELHVFLATGLPAQLLADMRSEQQELDDEVTALLREKEQQERERVRQKALDQDWSCRVTTGGDSTGRMAEADDELRLQQACAEVGMDWPHFGVSPSLD